MTSGRNYMTEHLIDQRVENARWLLDDVGLDMEQVARRLGVTVSCLEKLLERRA